MEPIASPEATMQATPPPEIVSALEAAQDSEAAVGGNASDSEQLQDIENGAVGEGETATRPTDATDNGELKDMCAMEKDAAEAQHVAEAEQLSTSEAVEENDDNGAEGDEVTAVKGSGNFVVDPEEKYGGGLAPSDVNGNEPGDEEVALAQGDLTSRDTAKAKVAGQDVEGLIDPLVIVQPKALGDVEEGLTSLGTDKPALVIDADALAEDLTSSNEVVIDNLIVNEVVATPGGDFRFAQALELASPAAMPEPLTAASDLSTEDAGEPVVFDGDVDKSDDQTGNGEKDELDNHATITAVTESTEKAVPIDANLEVVLEKIRSRLRCESVEVLESGEILVLPKGWSTRQSKSNDGKTYYVSPYGYTQWLRPPLKTGVIYNWVHEIEVTFGPGRLGLNLKQIAGVPGTIFTDLQVHVAEIYKLPNGMASPAEIYNWSVKPEKRLAANMRITMMNGVPVTGYTYVEVLELLARMVRPVRIKFADITKGIVGRVEEGVPHEETEEVKEARAARVMQNSLRTEYFQILVASELHKQVWATTKQRMYLKRLEMKKKCKFMEMQVENEQQHHESLEKERENLIEEEALLRDMIEKLDKQMAGEIESPEVIRTAELVQRTVELEKDVTEIIAENDTLQAARVEVEECLDLLQKELDEYGDLDMKLNDHQDIKFFSPAFLGSMVHRGSIDTRAEDAHERLLLKIKTQRDHFEEEIKMEEERAKFVESEIHQFRNQMDVAAAAVKREDAFISGERPPQLIFLENKIALLQKNLRETVVGIANAVKNGDEQQADNLSLRRADLKDDLKAALDEMRRMENELQVFFDVDEGTNVALQHTDSPIDTIDIDEAPQERTSESLRLQNKLLRLQTQLHETVAELAKAASDNDEAQKDRLGKRRLQLKDEMTVVQDQFQALTNGTLNVSAKAKESYVRPSIAGPSPVQDAPRKSTIGSRVSLSGLRGSIGSRASLVGGRASHGGNNASANAQEKFDPNRSHRSSSSASNASLTQPHDSGSNLLPRDGSAPTMSGILRKHPTHYNEKGTFGNMSLRGVRERWCNIESDGYLRYYKREGDREARGSISLKHKSLEILYGKEVGKPNEFMICSSTEQTRMIAKTHEEMLKWVKVLGLAHVYFMQQSMESRQAQADQTQSPGAELAYRNKRATLGF